MPHKKDWNGYNSPTDTIEYSSSISPYNHLWAVNVFGEWCVKMTFVMGKRLCAKVCSKAWSECRINACVYAFEVQNDTRTQERTNTSKYSAHILLPVPIPLKFPCSSHLSLFYIIQLNALDKRALVWTRISRSIMVSLTHSGSHPVQALFSGDLSAAVSPMLTFAILQVRWFPLSVNQSFYVDFAVCKSGGSLVSEPYLSASFCIATAWTGWFCTIYDPYMGAWL